MAVRRRHPPAPIGIYASAGRKHDDVRWTGVTLAAANQGNFYADERLKEQDIDGVDAEVLFGSARMMSHFFSDSDPEFHLAGVQAYNNWLAKEFVQKAPDRLIGLAAMPALGVEASIREMERCLKLGLRGGSYQHSAPVPVPRSAPTTIHSGMPPRGPASPSTSTSASCVRS